ncbi:MAG TPA: undecaprenyl-diphosphate phosphatase, partial [Anaerolineaceae bacterium]|nr:undecaprenyl-diphosphate phosphatase [Anaerolineaceae bacterium]
TSMVGTLERDMVMNLEMGDGTWKVLWDDGMIMPELKGGNYLMMDITVPSRGIIFDRNGEPLAAQQDAVALGVIPAEIADVEGSLLVELSNLIDKPIAAIKILYDDIRDAQWYVPVGEASASEVEARYNVLSQFPGLWMTKYSARFYNYGGVAPHTIGYVQSIFAEEVDEYRRQGYRGDEKVGAAGIEKWGEEYLAGTRGASLLVVDPQGQIVTRLGKRDSVASQSIYTTIDSEFQRGVQQAIAGFRGAIVVLEVDTGKVVAMASSPTFDPNSFETSNANSSYLLTDLFASEEQPLLNRATQGGYPLGSVFKIVTMAAALETGVFNQYSSYYCGHEFTELPGQVFYDWTYERGVAPSGELTLPEGLMRSCNPWFYHIGLELFRQNEPDAITEMAKGFGLGSATGIGQVAEDIGSIPYRTSLLIGLFQSIAMIPGVSRSAATIVGGLVLGLKRKTIVEFSFILAVPTMLAATVLDLMKNLNQFSIAQINFLSIGFILSFVFALLSVKFLLNFIKHHSFISFGIYRIILALLFWVFSSSMEHF